MNSVKRQNQIAQCIKKARAFYKDNGFMDLTRFATYFNNVKFESDEHKIHSITNWYCLIFGGKND